MLVLLGNYLLMRACSPVPSGITIPYTVFKQQVEAGNVVRVTGEGDTIHGTLKKELRYPPAAPPRRRSLLRCGSWRTASPRRPPRSS